MHGPGSAEGKYREAMRILTSFQGMDASGIRHAFIHNLVDAPGCLFNRNTQRVSDAFLNGSAGGSKVYPELASEKVIGIKVAKHQLSVGYRPLASPLPIADRTRPGPRPFSPYFQ